MKTLNPTQKTLLAIFATLLLVMVLFFATSEQDWGQKTPSQFADLGGEFSVETQSGTIHLSDFKGQTVVMYFGFLNCPDVCPNSMLTIQRALKKLTAQEKEQVQVILISVDPDRDDVDALADYVAFYDDNFIGATANKAVIDQITQQYAAFYSVDASDDYQVTHSSRYYVIDGEGQLQDAMRHSTTANELAARIRSVNPS